VFVDIKDVQDLGHKVTKDIKVPQVFKDTKVLSDLVEHKEHKAYKAL
jgi:hypothetical protein